MSTDVNAVKRINAYRDDIDGLRAIAVIAVMCFHFSIWPFTGGFIGVDVFFVISGYLITGGILKEDSKKEFCLYNFYIRRARRLFPALLCTIALTYLLSLIVFPPADFVKVSASTIFASMGLSNFFFWQSADYFDSLSIIKPLLHTWSLSVELQFYLVWPFLLLSISKAGNKFVFVGTLTLTIAGFLISFFAIDYDSTGAYYLTQYRFYEFTAGGMVFLFRKSKLYQKLDKAHFIIFLLGITLILYSVIEYSSKTIFPGVNALAPVLGTMLMIISGDNTKASWLLKINPLKYTGEISYSLYLVHWPIVVFSNYFFAPPFDLIQNLLLISLSFSIAIPMHKFIEKPFRTSNRNKNADIKFCSVNAVATTVLIIISTLSWEGDGWVWRLPKEIQSINKINIKAAESYVWQKHSELLAEHSSFKNNGNEKIVIVGDSQSADLLNMLIESKNIDKYDYVIRLVYRECGVPFISKNEREVFFNEENVNTIKRRNLIPECNKQMDLLMDSEALNKANKIYIAMLWKPEFVQKVHESLSAIKKVSSADIYIFGNKALRKSSISVIDDFGKISGVEAYSSQQRDKAYEAANAYLSMAKGVYYVDMMRLTCPEKDSCNVLTSELQPIFFDPAHLTKSGAIYLGAYLPEVISAARLNL